METSFKINNWPAAIVALGGFALAGVMFYLDRNLLHLVEHAIEVAVLSALPQAIARVGSAASAAPTTDAAAKGQGS